jgi:hypothetical protein
MKEKEREKKNIFCDRMPRHLPEEMAEVKIEINEQIKLGLSCAKLSSSLAS